MPLKTIMNGNKEYLIVGHYKFRYVRTLMDGTLSWRCCQKNCLCSAKTDKDKTRVLSSRIVHNHSAQVCSPTSTASTPQKTESRTTSPATSLSASSMPLTTPPTMLLTPTPTTPLTTPLTFSPTMPLTPTPTTPPTDNSQFAMTLSTTTTNVEDLIKENAELRQQLFDIRKERTVLLDHSIQSDQRLLQFTEDIFVVNGTSCSDTATQTETSNPPFFQPCQKCIILEDEVKKMVTSIRCLEEETKRLSNKSEFKSPTITPQNIYPIPLSNSFDLLNNINEENYDKFSTVTSKINKKKSKNHKTPSLKGKSSPNNLHRKPTQSIVHTPFDNVMITGDSHARHLATLVSESVSRKTKVTGMCKPGAGLLNIATNSSTPPDCTVLLAGTNDVAAGRQDIILQNFERVLQSLRQTSSLLVCPLPPRHDLPPRSPVHDVIFSVNCYIAELCGRYEGVELLNISGIGRRHYTSHGLHLRNSGKRILSRIIADKLSSLPAPRHRQRPPAANIKPPSIISHSPLPTPEPHILPFNTYSEALVQGLANKNRVNCNLSKQKNDCLTIGAKIV